MRIRRRKRINPYKKKKNRNCKPYPPDDCWLENMLVTPLVNDWAAATAEGKGVAYEADEPPGCIGIDCSGTDCSGIGSIDCNPRFFAYLLIIPTL
jgi:hypothetical protein